MEAPSGGKSDYSLPDSVPYSIDSAYYLPVSEHSTTDHPHVHDEFLQFVRDSGIENIAKEAGVITQDGEIPVLREYVSSNNPSPPSHSVSQETSITSSFPYKSEKEVEDDEDKDVQSKKRKRAQKTTTSDKGLKGLRHFSLKVCQNVERKKHTTYNEVADELVAEFNNSDNISSPVDQKNIRRRVYDALNVLMAMNIITKEKKEIKWIGLPTNAKQELEQLENERNARMEAVKRKRATFQELHSQQVGYKTLISRNSKPEYEDVEGLGMGRIELPFIIVNTKNTTVIECEVAEDRSAYFFNFSLPFEIHDDSEILKRMELIQ